MGVLVFDVVQEKWNKQWKALLDSVALVRGMLREWDAQLSPQPPV